MDINRIITETDLETIKARLLLGDSILIESLKYDIINCYKLSSDITIPSIEDGKLIIPKRSEIIKITRFQEIYAYHNRVIFWGNGIITMKNFLELYEEFSRKNNNVR